MTLMETNPLRLMRPRSKRRKHLMREEALQRQLMARATLWAKPTTERAIFIYLTNRNNKVWQFRIQDGANRLINTISPLNHNASRLFNNRGLVATNTDALGQTTIVGWSPRGWMTNRADAVGTTVYQQDLNGNVTNATENGKTFREQFDSHNWLTNYTDVNGYNIGYRRDNNGNVTSVIYPGGLTVSYAFDGNNRVTNVTDWASRKTAIAYDLAGHETSIIRPNNTVRSVGYDDDGEVANIVEKLTSQFPISFNTLHYNSVGRCDWEFKGPCRTLTRRLPEAALSTLTTGW